MSIYHNYTTAQTQGNNTVLMEKSSSSLDFDLNVKSITITNADKTLESCQVTIHTWDGASSRKNVLDVNIPAQATLVFDTPFTIPHDEKLTIVTSNDSNITVIIN